MILGQGSASEARDGKGGKKGRGSCLTVKLLVEACSRVGLWREREGGIAFCVVCFAASVGGVYFT